MLLVTRGADGVTLATLELQDESIRVLLELGNRVIRQDVGLTQRVENLSLADRNVLVSTVVQVADGTDLDALMPELVAVASRVPRVLSDPGPGVQLSAFASDGLELTLNFWIADAENGQGNVRSSVNLAVLQALNARGVEIPFPQRVYHTLPSTSTSPSTPQPVSSA